MPVKGEHPDFNRRSPNYIDIAAVAKGNWEREFNIVYYKTFPELADKHGWDMKKMKYTKEKADGVTRPSLTVHTNKGTFRSIEELLDEDARGK